MKEKIKMILCLCLIIAGLPILMTLVFQGDEILLDTDSNEIQHKSSHPDEEEKMAALVSILARDIPVTYEEEAIRAQAVIVRTNYEYALSQGKAPETGLSVAEQTKLFGNENYNRYYQKLENCLIDTEGEVLTYQGQEIEAPYLQSVQRKREGQSFLISKVPNPYGTLHQRIFLRWNSMMQENWWIPAIRHFRKQDLQRRIG